MKAQDGSLDEAQRMITGGRNSAAPFPGLRQLFFLRVLLPLSIVALLAGISSPPLAAQACEGDLTNEKLVRIRLVNPSIAGPELAIPEAYFADRFLKLVRKNLEGGDQKRVWLNVAYPSMCPAQTSSADASAENDQVILAIGAANNPHVKRFWRSANNLPWYPRRASSEYGIDEYLPRLDAPALKSAKERVFYSEDGELSGPVIIKCPLGAEDVVLCRVFTEMDRNIAIQARFRKKFMPEWRTVIDRIKAFVGRLVTSS